MNATKRGIAVLGDVLRRMRNDEQGGYDSVGVDGRFVRDDSIGIASAEELNALFELAGIEPDPIPVKGECGDCVFGNATRGRGDLGWADPCCICSRPIMSNFVPISSVTRKAIEITDLQASLLRTAKDCAWWAEGETVGEPCTPEWSARIKTCRQAEKQLVERDMLRESFGVRYLTRKGLLALKNHRKAA